MRPDEDCKPDAPVCSMQEAPSTMGRRRSSAQRKDELFQLAKAIAAQVEAGTRPHERCLLRNMVEMLLD